MSVRSHLWSMIFACLLFACTGDPKCAPGTVLVGSQCRPRPKPTDTPAGTEKRDAGPDANVPDDSSVSESLDAGPRAPVGSDSGPSNCVASDEVCNGRDDNCDGAIDEGLLKDFYLDDDGDGYGQGAAVPACGPPSPKHTTQNGDCDDTCKTCSPSTNEATCDGKDNDCDGRIDEGLGQTFYRDADADDFGDKNVTTTACKAPSGYVSDQTDCDDGCKTCNPAVSTDTTCDGKDDDCSGKADQGAPHTTYYRDCDKDTLATSTSGSVSTCAVPAPPRDCAWTKTQPTNDDNTDCNDGNAEVKPGQTKYFTTKIAGAAAAADFDYNCDHVETRSSVPACSETGCQLDKSCIQGALPECGAPYALSKGFLTPLDPIHGGGCVLRTVSNSTVVCR